MILRRHFCTATTLVAAGIHHQAVAQSDTKIILGQSAPFSGPAAQLGIQFYQGAKLYFDAVNAKGGIWNKSIELRTLDDGYEPERTAVNTQQFIHDKVFALFGYIGTPTSLVALPLATEAGVPFFAPFTGAQVLREPFNRYAVHVRASYFDETAAIVKQTTSIGIKKIGVFYQNDAYGKAGLEGVQRALKELNLQPTGLGTVERNSVDVKKAVTDIMAQQPEAIVQIGAYKGCAAFIREARKAGFGGTFYNVSFVGTQALATELGKEAAGVVVSQVVPFPFAANTPMVNEYLTAFAAVADNNKILTVNYSSMEGYVAAKVFVEALRRTGRNATREGFLNAVEDMQAQLIGGYAVDFGPKKHNGSKFVELTMLTADGRVRR
jgi:branched-chain amino acid transport system substrate-binding protein